MKRYQTILGSLGVAVVLLLLVVSYTDAQGPGTKPTPIPQQIFTVAPVHVIDVTTTTVEAAADGACSLIEAIVNANDDAQTHADCPAGSGADTILLEADAAYVLTQVNNTTVNDNGLPSIVSEMTISGTNATIKRDAAAPPFRIFYVAKTGTLTLDGLTIRGGECVSDSWGGGIFNWGAATLNDTTVISNTAPAGDGGGIFSMGVLTLTYSTVSYNTAGDGGGIFNLDGDLTLNDSTISHNLAGGEDESTGGGLSNFTISRTATVVLNNSVVMSNTVVDGIGGGGIANYAAINFPATLTLNDSLVQGNVASGNNHTRAFGGGIRNGGNIGPSGVGVAVGLVTLNNSIVRDNRAVNGGGIGNGSLSPSIPEMMTVTLNNSTVSGNVAAVSAGGFITQTGNGGGVFNVNGTLTVRNSTVSGNSAQGQPVPATQSGLGGGIANASAGVTTTVTFVNATIADNTGVGGGGLANAYLAPAPGYPSAVATFGNSLIAGNTDLFGATGCLNNPGAGTATITSQGYNLEDSITCGFSSATDLPATDPLLDPLADNGGDTWTHALSPSSPAVDQGSCPGVAADQRGLPRPVDFASIANAVGGDGCDIGAYEVQPAAPFTVTTTADELNDDGDCSLREAIQAANTDSAVDACPAGSGDDTIILPAGVYTLTIPGDDEDANATGDLDILDNLTLDGAGASTTIMDGGRLDRVLDIDAGVNVELNDVTITGGKCSGDGGGIYNDQGALALISTTVYSNVSSGFSGGGGIYNDQGAVTLSDSIVSSNDGNVEGGGIYNDEGALTLTNSTVRDNYAMNNGGIMSCGTVWVVSSTVSGNTAIGRSGGIYSYGVMTLTSSAISGNIGSDGGGILVLGGSATLSDTIVSDNQADDQWGGGISTGYEVALTLVNCTVSGNTSGLSGGGIDSSGETILINTAISGNSAVYGGGITNWWIITVTDSIVSNNTAASDSAGGGIINFGYYDPVTMTLINSMVFGNTAGDGGGINNYNKANLATMTLLNSAVFSNTAERYGGGIFNKGSVATLTNSTVSGNDGNASAGGIWNDGGAMTLEHTTISNNNGSAGGGIHTLEGAVTLKHSIVANNIGSSDCVSGTNASINSLGYNLDSDDTCNLTQPTDLPATDPLLDSLADNGGDTWTHALLEGSPAIDAIPAISCTLAADQRGVARPQDGNDDEIAACDIGAFEFVQFKIYLPLVIKNN